MTRSCLLSSCHMTVGEASGWPACRQARKRKAESSAEDKQPRAAPTGSNSTVRSALHAQLEAFWVTAKGAQLAFPSNRASAQSSSSQLQLLSCVCALHACGSDLI